MKSGTTDEWLKLKKACLERDDYSCQRCEKRNRQGQGMTAHHLVPRSEEGIDDLTNLVILCHPCHDYVEINNLRTLVDIIGSYETPVPKEIQTEEKTDEGYHFIRPAWHRWVYGGQRHEQENFVIKKTETT